VNTRAHLKTHIDAHLKVHADAKAAPPLHRTATFTTGLPAARCHGYWDSNSSGPLVMIPMNGGAMGDAATATGNRRTIFAESAEGGVYTGTAPTAFVRYNSAMRAHCFQQGLGMWRARDEKRTSPVRSTLNASLMVLSVTYTPGWSRGWSTSTAHAPTSTPTSATSSIPPTNGSGLASGWRNTSWLANEMAATVAAFGTTRCAVRLSECSGGIGRSSRRLLEGSRSAVPMLSFSTARTQTTPEPQRQKSLADRTKEALDQGGGRWSRFVQQMSLVGPAAAKKVSATIPSDVRSKAHPQLRVHSHASGKSMRVVQRGGHSASSPVYSAVGRHVGRTGKGRADAGEGGAQVLLHASANEYLTHLGAQQREYAEQVERTQRPKAGKSRGGGGVKSEEERAQIQAEAQRQAAATADADHRWHTPRLFEAQLSVSACEHAAKRFLVEYTEDIINPDRRTDVDGAYLGYFKDNPSCIAQSKYWDTRGVHDDSRVATFPLEAVMDTLVSASTATPTSAPTPSPTAAPTSAPSEPPTSGPTHGTFSPTAAPTAPPSFPVFNFNSMSQVTTSAPTPASNTTSPPTGAPTFLPWMEDLSDRDKETNPKTTQQGGQHKRLRNANVSNSTSSTSSSRQNTSVAPSRHAPSVNRSSQLLRPPYFARARAAATSAKRTCMPLFHAACTPKEENGSSRGGSGQKQCRTCKELQWAWATDTKGGSLGLKPSIDSTASSRTMMTADQLAVWLGSLALSGQAMERTKSYHTPSKVEGEPPIAATDALEERYRGYAKAVLEHSMGGTEFEALTKVHLSRRQLQQWFVLRGGSGDGRGLSYHPPATVGMRSTIEEDWSTIKRLFRQLPSSPRSAASAAPQGTAVVSAPTAATAPTAAATAAANPFCCAQLESCVRLEKQLAMPVQTTTNAAHAAHAAHRVPLGECSIVRVERGQECMRCAEGLRDESFVNCPISRQIARPVCYPSSCAETAQHSCAILRHLHSKSRRNKTMSLSRVSLPATGFLAAASTHSGHVSASSSSICWGCVQELVRLQVWGWQCLRKNALPLCYPHPLPVFPLPDLPSDWSHWGTVCAPSSLHRAIEQGCSSLVGKGAVCARCVKELGTTTRHVHVEFVAGKRRGAPPQRWQLCMCSGWEESTRAFCKWRKSGGRGWRR
jgi:hypothetical protein